jgi:hypothetical protein
VWSKNARDDGSGRQRKDQIILGHYCKSLWSGHDRREGQYDRLAASLFDLHVSSNGEDQTLARTPATGRCTKYNDVSVPWHGTGTVLHTSE